MWQSTTRSTRAGQSVLRSAGRGLLSFSWITLALLSTAFANPQTTGNYRIGQLVGQFELEAPNATSILLRGTLPVPRGTYVPGQQRVPFTIVDQDGTTLPTQMDAVTRYPLPADGADVVELAARVTIPEGTAPGTRLTYRVAYRPHPRQAFNLEPSLLAVPTEAGKVKIRAWDNFGNCYEADLAANSSTAILQDGPVTKVMRTHSTLVPLVPASTGAASDPLPHLMGVHAYFRLRADEPFVELSLRIHNGHSGNDPADPTDDALGEIYFKRIQLLVAPGLTAVQDFESPLSGPVVHSGHSNKLWIVSSSHDYPLHYMPKQAQFIRRFAIMREQHIERAKMYLEAKDVAYSRDATDPATGDRAYSWFNAETSCYFTQDITLPKLNHITPGQHRAKLAADLEFLTDKYNDGSGGHYPVSSDRLGWAHPWGVKDGGLAGGTEIYQYDGLRTLAGASRAGLLRMRLRFQMLTDRNPIALYNKDGEISQVEDWLLPGPNGDYLNCWYFLRPILDGTQQDPFGFTTSPNHQRVHIEANGLRPPYYNDLRRFNATDFQHYTRYTSPAKALIWQTNDHVAKDQMRMQAEAFRLSYNTYDNTRFGHVIGTGLKYDRQFVEDFPEVGLGYGRGEGWGTESMTAVYAFASDEWRARMLPWFTQIVAMVKDGQAPCTGIIHSQVQSQGFNGQYRGKQHTEQVIVENALIGMRETIFKDLDPDLVQTIDDILLSSFRGGTRGASWSTTLNGPFGRLAVGETDPAAGIFCDQLPSDGQAPWRDNSQSWSSLAFGYAMTGQGFYLDRAEQMAGSGAGPANLLDQLLTADQLNWENQAVLISMLERFISGD